MSEYSETRDNRRRNFRTPAPFRLTVRLAEWEEVEEARLKGDGVSLPGPGDGGSGELSGAESLALRQVMALMLRMDDKLNRILRKLDARDGDDRVVGVDKTVDISGSGLSFLGSERLEIGQLLHLSIEIAGSSPGRFDSYGEVKRCLDVGDACTGPYDTGVEFLFLSEEIREGLISYTFSRQRQLIRDTAKG